MKNTYRISAPVIFCFYQSGNQNLTLDFFQALENICGLETEQITVDFSDLEYMSAAAANYLFSIFTHYQTTRNHNFFQSILPKNTKQRNLFVNTGLYKAIKPGGTKKTQKLWNGSDFLCGNHQDITKLMDVVKRKCGITPFPEKLTTAMRETFLNIHHHAYSQINPIPPITWFCYFYVSSDKSGRYLSIIVQDLGIGIVPSIKRGFPTFSSQQDGICISHAMTKSVSSTGIDGRGMGSFDMKKPLLFNKLKGHDTLYVMSSKGSYTFEVSGEGEELIKFGQLEYNIRGTLIEWNLYY
ncbi:hypothetical protein [Aliivibrio wodanis]|uniref:hypothetical protein n=1 Tax=Aliivibrio wodanis TaxID=80852 RepID=UPI00406BFBFC